MTAETVVESSVTAKSNLVSSGFFERPRDRMTSTVVGVKGERQQCRRIKNRSRCQPRIRRIAIHVKSMLREQGSSFVTKTDVGLRSCCSCDSELP